MWSAWKGTGTEEERLAARSVGPSAARQEGLTAKPERGSIRQIATCANCWTMLEKSPATKQWHHASTGEVSC